MGSLSETDLGVIFESIEKEADKAQASRAKTDLALKKEREEIVEKRKEDAEEKIEGGEEYNIDEFNIDIDFDKINNTKWQ